jgi:hypothetical protein
MKILRYWKRVPLQDTATPVEWDLVPVQEITEEHMYWLAIIQQVRESKFFDYIIFERSEKILERHVKPIELEPA